MRRAAGEFAGGDDPEELVPVAQNSYVQHLPCIVGGRIEPADPQFGMMAAAAGIVGRLPGSMVSFSPGPAPDILPPVIRECSWAAGDGGCRTGGTVEDNQWGESRILPGTLLAAGIPRLDLVTDRQDEGGAAGHAPGLDAADFEPSSRVNIGPGRHCS